MSLGKVRSWRTREREEGRRGRGAAEGWGSHGEMDGGKGEDWGGRVWVARGSRRKREGPREGGRVTRRKGKRDTQRLGNRNGGREKFGGGSDW